MWESKWGNKVQGKMTQSEGVCVGVCACECVQQESC